MRRLWVAAGLGGLVLVGAVTYLRSEPPTSPPRLPDRATATGNTERVLPVAPSAELTAPRRGFIRGGEGVEDSARHRAPQPRYRPRDPREWQGMLVDVSYQVVCKDFCGLALACVAGVCGACTSDTDCGRRESCVLDHCLDTSRVSCRSYRDCGSGSVCMLSGLSPDPRGNAELRSFCSSEGAASP